MDQLEEQVLTNPQPAISQALHKMRKELRGLRRATWPARELAATLARDEVAGIDPDLRPAFRNCHDHVVQVADFVEGSRERAADLGDLYHTMVSEKTNGVMRVLTMVATVFIPLTFPCGLYGMNFDPAVSPYNMPELKWRYGYPAFWGVLIGILLTTLWVFRRQGWLSPSPRRGADPSQGD